MMNEILAPFTEFMRRIPLQSPRIPYISNVTGRWITSAETTDPRYWANHLRQAVRFSDGLKEILQDPHRILLEVGPGQTLSSLAKSQLGQAGRGGDAIVLSSLRHALEEKPDVAFMMNTLGRIWVNGGKVDWTGFHKHESRRRIPLPTYPFERQRYWIEANRQNNESTSTRVVSTARKEDVADWFYVPSWKRSVAPASSKLDESGHWLIFADQFGIGSGLATRLREQGADVVTVGIGEGFGKINETSYTVKPNRLEDYKALINDLNAQGRSPNRIFHLWLIDSAVPEQQYRGYNSLIHLTQALGSEMVTHPIQLAVVMTDVQEVTGEETIAPAKALALGACTVIPQEYANITCRRIDVALPNSDPAKERLSRQLLAEILGQSEDLIVAYRGVHRWVQIFEPTRLEQETLGLTRLKEGGVYLITGGLGGIGLVFAEHLSKNYKARLVLTGRTSLPPREEWAEWLETHEESETTARKILRVQEIEALGGEVEVFSADVADETKMGQAIAAARNRFQRIDGVIHTAGLGSTEMIQQLTPETSENVLTPKVKGTEVVFDLLKDDHLDFVALCSSVASILGGFAMADYCAANVYLDAFAHCQASSNGTQTVAINWDRWQEVGMAANPETTAGLSAQQQAELNKGIRTAEGVDAFERILRTNLGQVIVSTSNFDAKVTKSVKLKMVDDSGAGVKSSETLTYHPRPVLRSEYTAPRNDVDRALIDMWQGLLGIEEVGIHDNFFELGGHSLLATQFISRVRDTFKVELSLRQLFESGTIAELSEIIVAAESQTGQIGRIAQLLVMVENMSAEEVSRSLQERTQS
jgi:acyl transferase domain-containing protein